MEASTTHNFSNNSEPLKKNSITKNVIFTEVYNNLVEQVPKAHIIKIINTYHDVFMQHISKSALDFGWIIPGLVQVYFAPKNSSRRKEDVEEQIKKVNFYLYNDQSLLKEISQIVGYNESTVEYVINDYFDTCIYYISKRWQPGIASLFYLRFLGQNKLPRFYPSSALRAYCSSKGLKVSIHSLLNKGEA